jgi:hypothetical protein
MKAEHRKELQTNTLADNLGRLLQGGRSMSRRTVLILILIAAVLLGFWFWRTIQANNEAMRASLYVEFDLGNAQEMLEFSRENAGTEPSKAMKFQIAWLQLWKYGIEPLASNPFQARSSLEAAQESYRRLAEDVENDKVLSAEAHYAIALIEETLAATEDQSAGRVQKLKNATELYRRVEQDYPETAHGKQAAKRAEYLEKNRAEVLAFYDQMAGRDFTSFLRQFEQKQKASVPIVPPKK